MLDVVDVVNKSVVVVCCSVCVLYIPRGHGKVQSSGDQSAWTIWPSAGM